VVNRITFKISCTNLAADQMAGHPNSMFGRVTLRQENENDLLKS
jgi:hypothetical protein